MVKFNFNSSLATVIAVVPLCAVWLRKTDERDIHHPDDHTSQAN